MMAGTGFFLPEIQGSHLLLSTSISIAPTFLLTALLTSPPHSGHLGLHIRGALLHVPSAHHAPQKYLLCPRNLYCPQHSPVQNKTLSKALPACPKSYQSPKPSGADIVIARKLFIYHDLSDITVNAFQSTRSVKINCKEIKTAN